MDFAFSSLIVGLILASFSVYLMISVLMKQEGDKDALSWMEGKEPEKSKAPLIQFSRPLVHNFLLSHVKKVKFKKYRERLRKKILISGLSKELNVEEFIGLQLLWGICFPLLFFLFNTFLSLGFPPIATVIMALVGFYFPHAYCNSRRVARRIGVLEDLPVFVDIMALSTEAGLDFMGSITKIVEKAPENSILAEELETVLKDIKLGRSRSESLTDMDQRMDIPELSGIIRVIKDAEETGASISKALKDKAAQMRFERFARAEEAGAKASQKILIPMMIFIIPAVFIVIFAPAIFQFMGGGGL